MALFGMVTLSWMQIAAGVLLLILVVYMEDLFMRRRRSISLNGKVVVITGGSSGIGLATAKDVARQGGTCVLLARRMNVLQEAKAAVLSAVPGARVSIKTVDVTNSDAVAAVFADILKEEHQVDVLICSAGMSVCKRFEDTTPQEFSRVLRVNIEGCANCCRAVVGHMKRRRAGRICLVSSAAGQVGVLGYVGYSASKFGLRGFAESLAMELRPYKVLVSLAFPPDVNTPMLANDDLTKPPECAEISGTLKLQEPHEISARLVQGVRQGEFFINFDALGYLLGYLTTGFAPLHGVLNNLAAFVAFPIGRAIALFLLWDWSRICAKHAAKRAKAE